VFVGVTCAAVAALSATSSEAAYKLGDDDANLKLGALLQTWGALTGDAAPDGSVETEFYVRRMRLIFSGQINPTVNFFLETDTPNFGKGGNYEVTTFMQDAWVELNLIPSLQINAGMLLVPFSHHGMQGAGTLLAIDYHVAMLRYPFASNKVWRDAGLMARGLLFNDIVEYRLGVFNGVHGKSDLAPVKTDTQTWQQQADPRNPGDYPRVAGRLTLNAFEAEGGPGAVGFFYDGLYLQSADGVLVSPKKILSVGLSVDWQPQLNVDWGNVPVVAAPAVAVRPVEERSDYYALAADVFLDLPLAGVKHVALSGQVNGFYFEHGDRENPRAWLNEKSVDASGQRGLFTGYGMMAEAGLRVYSVQPVVLVDWFNSTRAPGDLGDYLAFAGGFNYWLFAHDTSIKVQAGASKHNGGDWIPSAVAQLQLMY
jgi:hypothetical protein